MPAGIDSFHAFGIGGLPEVEAGDDLAALIAHTEVTLNDSDILVIASKVVSKTQDMIRTIGSLEPSAEAMRLAQVTGKPARVCQVVIDESQRVWTNGTALMGLHRQGFELSSAGVDRLDDNTVILLPRDADASARQIATRLHELRGVKVAVVISDSHGRADRAGAGAVALGVHGIEPLRITETTQPDGRTKRADETICDMLAAAAALIMGQRGRGIPVVCLRGISYDYAPDATVRSILHAASPE